MLKIYANNKKMSHAIDDSTQALLNALDDGCSLYFRDADCSNLRIRNVAPLVKFQNCILSNGLIQNCRCFNIDIRDCSSSSPQSIYCILGLKLPGALINTLTVSSDFLYHPDGLYLLDMIDSFRVKTHLRIVQAAIECCDAYYYDKIVKRMAL